MKFELLERITPIQLIIYEFIRINSENTECYEASNFEICTRLNISEATCVSAKKELIKLKLITTKRDIGSNKTCYFCL